LSQCEISAFARRREAPAGGCGGAGEGTRAYGHNQFGALANGIMLTVLELVVLLAILRPWSYDRSWGRSLVAALLLLPVTAFSMLMTMHAGGIITLHFLWTLAALIGVTIAFVAGVVSRYRGLTR
jgi:hypothetical protein